MKVLIPKIKTFFMQTLAIHSINPEENKIKTAAQILMSNGIIIVPTDTNYAIVCLLGNKNGIEKICRIVGKKPEKANLSILCQNLKFISDFTLQFSKSTYKMLNKNLPGPFTFILNANNKVPKLFLNKKKTIGIRVPDNNILCKIIDFVGEPLVCSSIHIEQEEDETIAFQIPEIEKQFQKNVDLIIDGGNCPNQGSAVVDCTGDEPMIIREGYMPLKD